MNRQNLILIALVILAGLGFWFLARTPDTRPAVTNTDAGEGVPATGSGPRTPGTSPP